MIKLLITPDSYVTKHFQFKEVMCPCCQGLLWSDLFFRTMEAAERLRKLVDFPITINSGFRCEKNNRRVGGAVRSMHRLVALDMTPSRFTEHKLFMMHQLALKLGFTGIGRYYTFIHLDMRKRPYKWDNRKPGAVKR